MTAFAEIVIPRLPQAVIIGGIIVAVMAAVMVVYLVLYGFSSLFARRSDDKTLVERAEEIRPARGTFEEVDGSFARMVRGTMFGISAETAVGWILLVAAICAAAAYLITPDIIVAAIAFLVGGLMPLFVFLLYSGRRKRMIQEQLPDGCFQLARSLRSGLALPQALHETANYLPAPLAGLFERFSTALSLGESTTAALQRVADDARVTEFDLLTAVIATNIRSGGNLPAMLDRLAASIRDRNQYRGYFRSVTALSRISGFFLALAGPAIVLLYLAFQRDLFMKFVNAPTGQTLIIAAVVLEVIGLLWLLWLLRGQDNY